MRVFVTGATGFIGTAIVQELIGAGHQVLGLARSDASAQKLVAAGADVQHGDLEDLESLRSGAAQVDGVIQMAFGSDFSSPDALARSVAEESVALATLGEEFIGSDRPLATPTFRAESPPLHVIVSVVSVTIKSAVTTEASPTIAIRRPAQIGVLRRGAIRDVIRPGDRSKDHRTLPRLDH